MFPVLRRVLPDNTIDGHEAVTNAIPLFEQLQLFTPGTAFGKGDGGLGWDGGAAIGIKQAINKDETCDRPSLTDRRRQTTSGPESSIESITGHVSYMSRDGVSPLFLTVVLWQWRMEGYQSCRLGCRSYWVRCRMEPFRAGGLARLTICVRHCKQPCRLFKAGNRMH